MVHYFQYNSNATQEIRASKLKQSIRFYNKDSDVVTLMGLLDDAEAVQVYKDVLSPWVSPIQWLLLGKEHNLGAFEQAYYSVADLADHMVCARDWRGYGILIFSPYMDYERMHTRADEIMALLPWVRATISDSWYLANDGEFSLTLSVSTTAPNSMQNYKARKY